MGEERSYFLLAWLMMIKFGNGRGTADAEKEGLGKRNQEPQHTWMGQLYHFFEILIHVLQSLL